MTLKSFNRFPIVEDGDVEIWLTRKPEDRLLLPSVVLSLHSEWFRASLSKHWTSAQRTSSNPIIYELDFEDEKSASLVKRSILSQTVPVTDDFYFNKNSSYPTNFYEGRCEERDHVVRAYQSVFRAMFREPIDIDYEREDPNAISLGVMTVAYPYEVLQIIETVVNLGDYYGCLQSLAYPVEEFLKAFNHDAPFNPCALFKILPQISLKLESAWLFKEVVRGVATQFAWDDDRIRRELAPAIAFLALKKRTCFRQMMRDLDYELLSLEVAEIDTIEDPDAVQIASSCFRQFIFLRLFKDDSKEWVSFAIKYRTLVAHALSVDYDFELRNYWFSSESAGCNAYSLFGNLHEKAVTRIRQSFSNRPVEEDDYSDLYRFKSTHA
ncbi:MAG: hypothetical protein Q9221_003681 [Calogaya cf. arnoldii]